jgi:uncharacterized protein (DUF983 family)
MSTALQQVKDTDKMFVAAYPYFNPRGGFGVIRARFFHVAASCTPCIAGAHFQKTTDVPEHVAIVDAEIGCTWRAELPSPSRVC